jgi:hypothetical protein
MQKLARRCDRFRLERICTRCVKKLARVPGRYASASLCTVERPAPGRGALADVGTPIVRRPRVSRYAAMTADPHEYWQSATEDAEIQEEHGFIWEAMLDTVDVDLAGQRVLDAGCNRGGFLRLGFQPAVSRLKIGFVPVSGHTPSFPASLGYFYEHKVMFPFTRPSGSSPG